MQYGPTVGEPAPGEQRLTHVFPGSRVPLAAPPFTAVSTFPLSFVNGRPMAVFGAYIAGRCVVDGRSVVTHEAELASPGGERLLRAYRRRLCTVGRSRALGPSSLVARAALHEGALPEKMRFVVSSLVARLRDPRPPLRSHRQCSVVGPCGAADSIAAVPPPRDVDQRSREQRPGPGAGGRGHGARPARRRTHAAHGDHDDRAPKDGRRCACGRRRRFGTAPRPRQSRSERDNATGYRDLMFGTSFGKARRE